MKILIIIKNSPEQLFLVDVKDKRLIRDIKEMIEHSQHTRAMARILAEGKFERELSRKELFYINADLILTKNNARWDLTA